MDFHAIICNIIIVYLYLIFERDKLMKKITALLLVFVTMLVLLMPVSSLRNADFDYVFSAYTTYGFDYSKTAGISLSTQKKGAYPYFHLTANAGSYENNDLVFSLTPNNIAISDRPYVKISYRTDSPAQVLDVSMQCAAGEKWLTNHPELNSDGKLNTIIFNYNDIIGSSIPFPEDGERGIMLKLKPFGSQSFTLDTEYYFDINYIAFFETPEDAETFVYHEDEVATDAYTYNVLTADALYSKYASAVTVASKSYNRISNSASYVRYVAAPGKYNNNELIVSFSHDAFLLSEYPYVLLSYRTDFDQKDTLDVSITSSKGEAWLPTKPSMIHDGKAHTVLFSLNDMTGGKGVPDATDSDISIRLKPWGSGDKELEANYYFDIMYVGFFKEKSEAEDYIYPGDQKFPHNFSHDQFVPNYSYASNPTVMKYIEESDVRRDEILYANNTVPYENHLTLSNVKGVYEGNYQNSSFKITPNGNSGIISFTQNDVDFKDFPYIKIGYDTNSDSVSVAYKNTSNVQSDLTMTNGIINASSAANMKSLEIIPFTSGETSADKYFSIDYIGIFKTEAEAKAYTYKGENADNMTDTHIIYTANLLDPQNTATGTVYFVSATAGDPPVYSFLDPDYGKTPDNPMTMDHLISKQFNNCTVFFKRGDTFRLTSPFITQANTTYTSYGYGDKPYMLASIDGTGAEKWSETGTENIWVFSQTISNNTQQGDVGNIRINGGELWGIKVSVHNNDDYRMDNGAVFNGRTHIEPLADVAVNGGLGLYNDLEFHHDYTTGKLYLYCEDGNPGEVFDSIEIADKGHVFGTNCSYTVIDNIHAAGAGSHGFGYGNVNDSTVSNCFLEWIGGSIQTKYLYDNEAKSPTRYGNAVESYGSAKNFTIKNCFASQIYDCCWTVQNTGAVEFSNVEMYDNVAEYSNSGLEIWQSGGTTDHLYLHDNYTRYGGYGWSHQRPTKDGNFFYGGLGIRETTFTNCSIENNINILASSTALQVSEIGSTRYNFNHNVYIMADDKILTNAPTDTEHGTGAYGVIKYKYANIQEITSLGTEEGSTFYFVPKDMMNIGDDPYEVFGTTGSNPIYDIVSVTDNLTLSVDEIHNLTVDVYPQNPSGGIYYSSSNENVVSVDQNGVIHANYPGTALVFINSIESEVTETVKVSVIAPIETVELFENGVENAVQTNILFVGDEFLLGNTPLSSKLAEKYFIEYENLSTRGASVQDGISTVLKEADITPEIVLISLGHNDYLNSVSLEDFKASLTESINAAHNAFPYSKIIYITPPMVNTAENSAGYTVADYNQVACAVCLEHQAAYADLYSYAGSAFMLTDKDGNPGEFNPGYFDNNLIPSDKGAGVLANELIKVCAKSGHISVNGTLYENRFSAAALYENMTLRGGLTSGGKVNALGKRFVRSTAVSASVTDDNTYVQFDFPNADFDINKYPYMKVYYRSNVQDTEAKIDINLSIYVDGSPTRLWANKTKIDYTKSEALDSFTVNLAEIIDGGENGVASLSKADKDSAPAYVRLKYYYNKRPINAGDYFDIESIAFYQSPEEAALDGVMPEAALEVTCGDINSDDSIDIIDLLMLSRYIAGWNGYRNGIDFAAADTNHDGYIDTLDGIVLARYVAKWGGYERLPV